MLWWAGGCSCMRVAIESEFFNIMLLVLILKWKKNKSSVKKQKNVICWFLKMVEKCNFQQHHCVAGVLVKNLVILLQSQLVILHLHFIDFAMGLKYHDYFQPIHGGDEHQVCLKNIKLLKSQCKPPIPVYNSCDRFVMDLWDSFNQKFK